MAEGTLRFRCTYAQAASGAGYPVPRLNTRANCREARNLRVSTVYRALRSLESAGLVRFHGVKRSDGRWRCLSVGLTPAGYGHAHVFGRSRRSPTRGPGGRISFLRRNGTSPPVAIAKNRPRGVGVPASARAGPPTAAGEERGSFLAVALAAAQPDTEAPARRPWPNERFDVPDPELVELVELFEEAFDCPAKFSFERHGPGLRRALDRFERFTGTSGHTRRAGYAEAAKLIRRWGRLARTGNRRASKVNSLAYFVPKLDQLSKRRRREWKRTYGPLWAEQESR